MGQVQETRALLLDVSEDNSRIEYLNKYYLRHKD